MSGLGLSDLFRDTDGDNRDKYDDAVDALMAGVGPDVGGDAQMADTRGVEALAPEAEAVTLRLLDGVDGLFASELDAMLDGPTSLEVDGEPVSLDHIENLILRLTAEEKEELRGLTGRPASAANWQAMCGGERSANWQQLVSKISQLVGKFLDAPLQGIEKFVTAKGVHLSREMLKSRMAPRWAPVRRYLRSIESLRAEINITREGERAIDEKLQQPLLEDLVLQITPYLFPGEKVSSYFPTRENSMLNTIVRNGLANRLSLPEESN